MKSKEEITKIIYQNSHDCGEGLVINFENIPKVIDLIYSQFTQAAGAGDMTAREFFTADESPLTLDFLSPDEQDTLLNAVELYAKGKIHQSLLSLSNEAIETGKNKPFIVANVREIVHECIVGENISFGKMVELFNEVAERFYGQKDSEILGLQLQNHDIGIENKALKQASRTTDGKRYDFREFLKWFKENYNVKIRDEVVNDYLSSLPAPPSQKH